MQRRPNPISLKEANDFLQNFLSQNIDSKFHISDGFFFLKYKNDNKIYLTGDWFCLRQGLLLSTNHLLFPAETRKEFIHRLEEFIDSWQISFISEIELSTTFNNEPLLKLKFDNNDTFILIGEEKTDTFPSFSHNNTVLSFDFPQKEFILTTKRDN